MENLKHRRVVLNSLQVVRARTLVYGYMPLKINIELASITSTDLICFIDSSSDPALQGASIIVDTFRRHIFSSDD
jgi:hypothetical protein